MDVIIVCAILIAILFIEHIPDKFVLPSKILIKETDNGWVVYSKNWETINRFVEKWNDILDMYNEVVIYELPGVYWNKPIYKVNIKGYRKLINGKINEDGLEEYNGGYIYHIDLPPVSDDWGWHNPEGK